MWIWPVLENRIKLFHLSFFSNHNRESTFFTEDCYISHFNCVWLCALIYRRRKLHQYSPSLYSTGVAMLFPSWTGKVKRKLSLAASTLNFYPWLQPPGSSSMDFSLVKSTEAATIFLLACFQFNHYFDTRDRNTNKSV